MDTTVPERPPPPNPAASHEENLRERWRWFVANQPREVHPKLLHYEYLVVACFLSMPFEVVDGPMAILVKALVWLEPRHVAAVELRMHWIMKEIVKYLNNQPADTFTQKHRSAGTTPMHKCARRLKSLMTRGSPSHIIEFLAPKYPPSEFLTKGGAEAYRRRFATTIVDNHRELKKIWTAHHQKIQKRWKDKNRGKRQNILTDAWRNINPKPWMALEAWIKNNDSAIKEAALYWPSINLENWSEKELFLKFLQMRVEYPPDYFVRVDQMSLQFGYEIGRIHLPYLHGFAMQFLGFDTAENYGKLASIENWKEDYNKELLVMGGRTMNVGHGIATMKVQAHIYTTLLACCMNLLTAEEKKSLTDQGPDSDPSTSSGKGVESGSSESSTLPVAITNQLCQFPGQPNFPSLLGRVEARLEYAKDHLWALREDPAQFRVALKDCRDYEAEYWKARMENENPDKIYTEAHAENDIVTRTFMAAFDAVTAWDTINTSLQSIRQLMDREETRHIGYRDEAPLDLQAEWCQADYFVDHWITSWTKLLHGHLRYSPLIRDWREEREEINEENKQKSQKMRKKEKKAKTEEQLKEELDLEQKYQHILAITEATKKPEFPSLEVFKILIDQLDAQLENDQVLRQYIAPFVQHDISQISLLLDCRAHLRLIPWAPAFLKAKRARPDEIPTDHMKRVNADELTFQPLCDVDWKEADAWVTEKDLEYPFGENRTKEIVEKLQKAESVLDKFWKAVDDNMKERGEAWPAYLGEIFNRTPERTADWVKPPITGYKRARTETSETASERPSKKAKRKGIADPARALPQKEKQEDPEEPERMYEVNRRAMKAFDMIFFETGMSGHAGEMRWSEFVRALNAIGFTHKPNGGSSFYFTAPDHLKAKGGETIDFHAPHDGKLPFDHARRNGYRLRRRYGLHHGVFCLSS